MNQPALQVCAGLHERVHTHEIALDYTYRCMIIQIRVAERGKRYDRSTFLEKGPQRLPVVHVERMKRKTVVTEQMGDLCSRIIHAHDMNAGLSKQMFAKMRSDKSGASQYGYRSRPVMLHSYPFTCRSGVKILYCSPR